MNDWFSYPDYTDWSSSVRDFLSNYTPSPYEPYRGESQNPCITNWHIGCAGAPASQYYSGGSPFFNESTETDTRFQNMALFGVALVAGLLIFRK